MEMGYQDELDSNRFGLKFNNRRIEEEFRFLSHKRNALKLRVQLVIGGMFVICISLMDFYFMPTEFALAAAKLRGGFMLTVIFATLVMSFAACSHRVMALAGSSVGLCVGLTSLAIGLLAQRAGAPPAFSGYLVITVYIYFFLGLRTWLATGTGVTLLLSYLTVVLLFVESPGTVVIYNGMFLAFMNVLCCVGLYLLEEARRSAYLTEQILHRRATRDSMTQLSNRSVFDTVFPKLWQQCIESKLRLSLLIIDIDHFKLYNDCYGHQKGDEAIAAVARVFDRIAKRPGDLACRYGGEEFAILLSDARIAYAQTQAQRLCEAVLALKIPHKDSCTAQFLTVSVGLSLIWPHKQQHTPESFVLSADEALYSAKRTGRNRCVLSDADANRGHLEPDAEKYLPI